MYDDGGGWEERLERKCDTLETDLGRAIADRAYLKDKLASIFRQAEHGLEGLERIQLLAILNNIRLTAGNALDALEGGDR